MIYVGSADPDDLRSLSAARRSLMPMTGNGLTGR
jgi:hypothetical protein